MLKIPLEVFGDGKQLRDPVYVDDVVEAFLMAGLAAPLPSRTYNVGGREALSMWEIARAMATAGGGAEPQFRPFPEDHRAIDIGSYRTDSRRIVRELGWEQKVAFADGLARTLEFYKCELPHYLDPNEPNPPCKMPEHSGVARRLTYAEIS
jgi:nucleoside-diphosphate-sugar epimerase